MVSSGPALCEAGRRGLSADGFRRAGLALCEAGVDFVERTWTYMSRVRLAPAPAPPARWERTRSAAESGVKSLGAGVNLVRGQRVARHADAVGVFPRASLNVM